MPTQVACTSGGPTRRRPCLPGPTTRTSRFGPRPANATRGNFETWAKEWCLSLDTHQGYLDKLGVDRLEHLARRATPNAWREDAASLPIHQSPTPHRAELVAIHASRALVQRITDSRADAVLAGAGLANLAAWSAVAAARDDGVDVHLTAEMGMWNYHPVPADPYIFNFRTFPSATSLSDADHILGTLVGGPGTRSIGCIGCGQFDRHGNLNSTDIPDGPFLVGSGGANDVATLADETLVVAPLTRRRAVEAVGYVTSPGQLVRTVATDKGVLSKDHHGELVLTSVAAGPGSSDDRIRDAIDACGWPLTVARQVHQEPAVQQRELTGLRTFDRRGAFLHG